MPIQTKENVRELFSVSANVVISSSAATANTTHSLPTYNEHQHRASLKSSIRARGIVLDDPESIEKMEEFLRIESQSPPHFDHLPTQIDEMSYAELRHMEVGIGIKNSDEFRACLAARDYLRSDPKKFVEERQAERRR